MGLFDFLKGKKKDDDQQKPIARNVLNLQVNDIVTYDLEDYIVVGKIVYSDSGYEWSAYQIKGDTRSVWLSAEMDDQLEVGIYERVQTKISTKIPDELQVEGITYYLEEQGFATIKEAVGQAGAAVGQRVEYWEFESDNEDYLSIEKWGGDMEVSKGYSITEKELKIIAGS
jgi:CO dehydrogenase/acetyl-CoA synthase beta subunit